jgi:hypothetical protein
MAGKPAGAEIGVAIAKQVQTRLCSAGGLAAKVSLAKKRPNDGFFAMDRQATSESVVPRSFRRKFGGSGFSMMHRLRLET